MKRILAIILMSIALPCAVLSAPRHVECVCNDGRWTFMVDGKPFYMNSATVYTSQPFNLQPADFGANSIRSFRFSVPAKPLLDKCESAGLMVHVGLAFESIRSGYYAKDEAAAIARQEKEILDLVRSIKDHPAVLCWCIGNEFEIGHADEPLLPQYESIQRIASEIHRIDPNHPVTLTMTAGMTPAKINGLVNICKDLDFISVNSYISPDFKFKISDQIDRLEKAGWNKGYACTEFGPIGWWQHEKLPERRYTDWGAVVDLTSTEKEPLYRTCVEALLADKRCMGFSVFLWGNQTSWRDEVKEWYGLIDKEGYTYGVVDVMQEFWTGHAPAVKAPRIESRSDLKMNGKVAADWIKVAPGSLNKAVVKAVATNKAAPLRYHWRIIKERTSAYDNKLHDGLTGLIESDGGRNIKFHAPSIPGAYRLIVHVYDDTNRKAAYASIPFLVEGADIKLRKEAALE